jgi:dUTPase
MKFEKVKEIVSVGKKNLYHLTVRKNHNFFGNNICLHNCGYRGEIKIILANFDKIPHTIKHGDRIAQGVVCPVYGEGNLTLEKVNELSETIRNDNGFGSTGKK